MNRQLFAGSALSTALGLVLAAASMPAQTQGMDMSKAPQVVKDNMARMQTNKLEIGRAHV